MRFSVFGSMVKYCDPQRNHMLEVFSSDAVTLFPSLPPPHVALELRTLVSRFSFMSVSDSLWSWVVNHGGNMRAALAVAVASPTTCVTAEGALHGVQIGRVTASLTVLPAGMLLRVDFGFFTPDANDLLRDEAHMLARKVTVQRAPAVPKECEWWLRRIDSIVPTALHFMEPGAEVLLPCDGLDGHTTTLSISSNDATFCAPDVEKSLTALVALRSFTCESSNFESSQSLKPRFFAQLLSLRLFYGHPQVSITSFLLLAFVVILPLYLFQTTSFFSPPNPHIHIRSPSRKSPPRQRHRRTRRRCPLRLRLHDRCGLVVRRAAAAALHQLRRGRRKLLSELRRGLRPSPRQLCRAPTGVHAHLRVRRVP